MLRVFGDFETFYIEGEYTLKKMSPIEYILDKRFEVIMCAIAVEHEPAQIMPQDEVASFLRRIKENYAFISHNALFDACILSYHYDIHPPVLFDTMSMARALLSHVLPKNGSVALDSVAKHLNLPLKIKGVLQSMSGKTYDDIEPDRMLELIGYAVQDVDNCREIFFKLRDQFPHDEARIMDMVIRMATRPQLYANSIGLHRHLDAVRQHKWRLLAQGGGDLRDYLSNDKFAAMLEALGVPVPMKYSVAQKKMVPALARTDDGLRELEEHPDFRVQALVAARLGLKSTIEETRSVRFTNITDMTRQRMGGPWLPVPLKYSGAHTHRLSGEYRMNMQNLSNRKNRGLRTCIIAPPGHTIVAVDAAQIEARLTAWLAEETKLTDAFAQGQDVYKEFASTIYNVELSEVTKVQRFTGKTCILGLGFGMSGEKLLDTLVVAAREAGFEVDYSIDQTKQWVTAYRKKYQRIPFLWDDFQNWLAKIVQGDGDGFKLGPLTLEVKSSAVISAAIVLPSGLRLHYENMEMNGNRYVYRNRGVPTHIYGGKLTENAVQALDRQKVMEAALAVKKRTGHRLALQVHDENVYVVPNRDVDGFIKVAHEEMCRKPSWGKGLPLAAEVKIGDNYGELEDVTPRVNT